MNKSLPSALSAYLAPLQARWRDLAPGERLALTGLALFLAGLAAWFAVIVPVTGYAAGARAELAEESRNLAWMQANAMRARQAAASGAGHLGVGQSLLSAVSSSAKDAGINLQRFEPEGDQRVRVTLENAVFTDVMRWIVDVERRYGLVVQDFNADNQAQPGVVNIRLTLGIAP